MKGKKPNVKTEAKAIGYKSPPAWLTKAAKAEWRRVMPVLAERRILTEADLGSLENYCIAIGRVRDMEAEIQRSGAIVEIYRQDKDGNPVLFSVRRNPAVSIWSDSMNRARLLAAELGCTPVSRSRPEVQDAGDEDELFGFNEGS